MYVWDLKYNQRLRWSAVLWVPRASSVSNKENAHVEHYWSFARGANWFSETRNDNPIHNFGPGDKALTRQCWLVNWIVRKNCRWNLNRNTMISLKKTLQTICRSFFFRRKVVNTLRPRQNGRPFPDDIFKCIFMNENAWISITISLKFVPKGPINKIPALVWIMAWRLSGDKPWSEPMMVSLLTHICVTRPQWVKLSILWQSSGVRKFSH